jgi:hypothetical protein
MVENSFKENFFWSKGANSLIILISDKTPYINSEYLTSELIKYDNWAYHYFVPSVETTDKNNLLLLCFFQDFFLKDDKLNLIDSSDLHSIFKNSIIYYDLDKILNILVNNIIWNKTNLNNHSLVWCLKSQQLISNFLDLILYSDCSLSDLNHWGYSKLELKKNELLKERDYKEFFYEYNEFIKVYKNFDTPDKDLKWYFVKNYK